MLNRLLRVGLILCVITAVFGMTVSSTSAASPLVNPEESPSLTAISGVTVNAPYDVFIGEDFNFTVTFDNTGDTTGYGPYIDLIFPSTGIDGDDGITFNSATYLGIPVETVDLLVTDTAPLGDGLGCVTHPYAKDASGAFIQICGLTVGDHFVSLLLPFGSFVPDQTPAQLTISASLSNLADLGQVLPITYSGGYMFGDDALDNPTTDPSIIGASASIDINPTLFTLTKTYNGPEDETATGPNYPRTYTLTVDVAAGQDLTNFDLMDYLPNNMQFMSVVSSNPAYVVASSTLASTTTPGGEFTLFYNLIDGNTDLTVIFEYYIPLNDLGASRVINPNSGDDVFSCNQTAGLGDWVPLDPRDRLGATDNASAGGHDGTCNDEPHEHQLTDKSIAIQKDVAIVQDNNAPGTSPLDVLEYTLNFQISDYFAFDNLVVTDTFSDGQHWLDSFTPTLTVNGNQYVLSAITFDATNYIVDTSQIGNNTDPATNGTTIVTFNVSDQILASNAIPDTDPADFGWMVGGCIPVISDGTARDTAINPGLNPNCSLYNNAATTATITFRTTILENFTDTYPSGDSSVDQGDVLGDSVTVSGDLLSVADLTHSGYLSEADGSTASVSIAYGVIGKSIYAINGAICGGTGCTSVQVAPGDTVTYRIQYTLPTSDFEDLYFIDYLPLPVFDVTEMNLTLDPTVSAAAPAAGQIKFGPADTFYNYSAYPIQTISSDASQNSLQFYYGNFDSVNNQATNIDILFTVTVKNDPFADGLYLTNQVSAFEESTNSGSNEENAIVQIQLTEPVLDFTKGVVWVSPDQSQAVFNPTVVGPVTFSYNTANPADCSRFSGTLNSTGLVNSPVNSNLSGVDAGDIALMAIVVENTGSGLNGAFDVRVTDSLPTGMTLVPNSICVSDGSGAGITFTGNLFGAGLELTDPGPTNPDPGALDAYDPSDGRNIAVVTYAVSMDAGVTPGQNLINTSALTNFAGTEGGVDHTVVDPQDTATIQTLSPSFDKAFTSTEINSAGNGNPQAVIGELVTYTLTATFQEGLTPAAQIVDTLDSGLAMVDVVSITASSGVSSTGMTFNASGLCTNCTAGTGAGSNPLVANNGHLVTFNFGDVSNSNSSNTVSETITIVYRAVVLNISTNQGGTVLNNSAVFSYTGGSSTDSADNITVVEPNVNLTKTIQRTLPAPAAAGPYDAGDQVTYTITISNTGTIDAFDISVRDQLPTTVLGSLTVASVSDTATTAPLTIADFNISAAGLLTSLPASAFDLPANNARTVTLRITGIILPSITPNQAIANTASVAWTSLNGDVTDRSTFNSDSDERTGADGVGGALNDYARNAAVSVNARNLSGTKYLVATSEAGTAGINVTIGEIVRYRLAMQIPEGTSPDLAMFDRLPDNLQFLNDGSARFVFVSTSGLSSSTLVPAVNLVGTAADPASVPSASVTGVLPDSAISSSRTTNADVYISGTDVYFKLGTITNTSENDLDLEYIIVEFNALVLNTIANQAYDNSSGTALANADRANDFQGRLNVATTNTNAFTSLPVTVRISEPAITNLTKAITSPVPAQAEAGSTITYSVTYSNVSGANASPAYNVVFSDVIHPKLSLAPASVVTTSACAVGVTNNSTASTINISIDTLPTGCAVSITYSASVRTTVIPGETLNNSAQVVYTSLPGDFGTNPNPTGSILVTGTNNPGSATGERTGVGGINDYLDTSIAGLVIFQVAPAKSLISSSDPNTSGSDLTIGETARYRLQVLLVQATSPAFTIRDYMPDYMEYLNDGLTQVALVSQNGITSDTLSGAGLQVVGDESNLSTITPTFVLPAGAISITGNDPLFSLGELRNNDNDANNEYVVLEFNARMLNVSNNQLTSPATTRSDNFTVSIDGVERLPSNTVTVNVVEPRITTTKSVVPTSGVESGDVLTYTLTMQNTGTAPAYDVTFEDVLAQGVAYNVNSMSCLLNSIASPATVSGTSTLLVDSNPAGLWDIAVGQSLVCNYTVTAQDSLYADGSHTNIADADWSSLNDNPAEERDYDDGTVYSVDGSQDTNTAVFTVDAPVLAKSVDPVIATIGETVTYTLTINSPLGTIQDFVVTDILPAGMIFTGTPVITNLSNVAVQMTGINDGSAVVTLSWDFGDEVISNSPMTISYQAIVANVIGNQQGVRLTNQAHLNYTNAIDEPVTGTTVTSDVDLVEPTLTIDKTFNTADAPFDAGDTIIYTLVVSNASGTTAYDAVITDTVFGNSPLVFSVDPGSSGAVVNASFTGNDLTATIDQLDDNASVTVVVHVTIPDSVTPGQIINNNVDLTWTSLAADDDPNERNGDDGETGPLDDYADSDQTSLTVGVISISKSMIATSAAHTADQDLAIGEVGTFELLITFPEGTITAPIAIQDQMPAGLNLLAITDVDTTNFNAAISVGEPADNSTYGVGGLLQLDFVSDVVVASNNDPSDNLLRVVYTARLENIASNQNTVSMDNNASLSWDGNDPLVAEPVTVTVVEPELQVTKAADVTTPVYGQTITYTLNVSHLSTSTATAFTIDVTDVIPAGLTYSPGSITAPTGWVVDDSAAPNLHWTCNAPACSLPTADSASLAYQVSVDLPPSVDPSDVLTNNVVVIWTSLPDDTDNDRDGSGGVNDYTTATDTDVTLTNFDLNITKDDGVLQYVPGESVTYTIVVNNVGNGDALNAVVSDIIPAQFVSWSWTCVQTGGAANCAAYAGSADFNNVVDLPSGSSITYTVIAQIASATEGDLTNIVRVTPETGLETDPTPDDNEATDIDTQNSQADLSVTKDDGVTVYVPGESVTYNIVVSNAGPSDAPASVVSDDIPTQFSSWSWSCVEAGGAIGCSPVTDVTVDFTDTVDLPAGSSITYTVTAQIASSAVGDLTNTVIVATGSGITDPNLDNNEASDTDNQDSQADLSVTKDDGVTVYVPGESVTYDIVVSNAGPSDAPGSLVSDEIPIQFTSWSWTCVEAGGATDCDGVSNSTTDFSDTVDLPTGSSITYTVIAQIASSATGVLTNTVTVATDSGITDPTPEDNTATDTDTQNSQVDLSVTKDDGVAIYTPGSSLTYTIVVRNLGPSDAPASLVSDVIPNQFTSWSWTCVEADGATGCDGVTDSAADFSDTVDLPAGSSITYTIVAQVNSAATGDLTNTVTVTTGSGITDINDGNNSADDTDTQYSISDLGVVKNVSETEYVPGGTLTYTITATNYGPSDANLVVLTEIVPNNTTFNGTSGWTCSPLSGIAGATCTYPVGLLTNGSSIDVSFAVTIEDPLEEGVTDILNQVSIDHDGEDSNPDNNDDDLTVTVDAAPDMTITKDDGVVQTAPGSALTYTVVVSNVGNQDATGVVVTDTLPAGITLVAASDDGVYDDVTREITWNLGFFAGQTSRTLTIAFTVDNPFPGGTGEILNIVVVEDDGTNGDDPTPEDNSAEDRDLISLMDKIVISTNQDHTDQLDVAIGEIVRYQVNLLVAPGLVESLVFEDILDQGLAFVGCHGITTSPADVLLLQPGITLNGLCTMAVIGNYPLESTNVLDNGRRMVINFGNITNQSDEDIVLAIQYDVVVLNNESNVSQQQRRNSASWDWTGGHLDLQSSPLTIVEPDLTIAKSVDPNTALSGDVVTYTLTIQHTPDSETDAFNVLINDQVPSQLTFVPGSLTFVSGTIPDLLQEINAPYLRIGWDVLPLSAEATVITYQARITNARPDEKIENIASLSWTSLPGDVSGNQTPNNPYSNERTFLPGSNVDNYGSSSAAVLSIPPLPETGFAPGVKSIVPVQPQGSQYNAIGDLWLEIPKQNLNLPIIGIPLNPQGWDLTWLSNQIGYLEGTAYPTWKGNTGLTAHVYNADGTAGPFVNLHLLRWGDKVMVHAFGNIYTYEVRSVERVAASNLNSLKHEDQSTMTLITCQGYDEVNDRYTWRVVVRTVLTSVIPE